MPRLPSALLVLSLFASAPPSLAQPKPSVQDAQPDRTPADYYQALGEIESVAPFDSQAAMRLLEEGLASHPDDPGLRFAYGTILMNLMHIDRARAELERAIELEPDFSSAALNLAVLEFTAGNLDACDKSLEQLSRLDANAADAMRRTVREARLLLAGRKPKLERGSPQAFVEEFMRGLGEDPVRAAESALSDRLVTTMARSVARDREGAELTGIQRRRFLDGLTSAWVKRAKRYQAYAVWNATEDAGDRVVVRMSALSGKSKSKLAANQPALREAVKSDEGAKTILDPAVWSVLESLSPDERIAYMDRAAYARQWDTIHLYAHVIRTDDGYRIDDIHGGSPPRSIIGVTATTIGLVREGKLDGEKTGIIPPESAFDQPAEPPSSAYEAGRRCGEATAPFVWTGVLFAIFWSIRRRRRRKSEQKNIADDFS